MLKYFTKRLVALVLIIIAISIGSFYMIHLLPGDLATMILGVGNTPENKKRLFAQLGLDKGLVEQYFTWMSHVVQGDLGKSYITGESINSSIAKALPIDLEMIFISQILAFAAAIPLAMKAAKKPNGLFDRFSNALTFGLLSIPSVIIVVYLVLLIAIMW